MHAVHGRGIKPGLEEMADLVPADIHPATERIVHPPNAASQRVSPVRDGNQVDVIGHQAIAQQLHVMKLAVFGEQFQVEFPVSIREESSGAVIAALRDMLGHANGDHASDSRHLQDIVASAADSSHPKSGIVVTVPLGPAQADPDAAQSTSLFPLVTPALEAGLFAE